MRNSKGQFVKGENNPWTEEHKKNHKKSLSKGNKHHNWKGDNISYKGLHTWISRNFGKPMRCEQCHSTGKERYQWANISGKYLRDRNDWKRLCPLCHYKYDFGNKNPNQKLTKEDVEFIINTPKKYGSEKMLANKFNVCTATIRYTRDLAY